MAETQTILDLIANERIRQIQKGWTLEHDRRHWDGQLAKASALILDNAMQHYDGNHDEMAMGYRSAPMPSGWPWPQEPESWKIRGLEYDLIVAAALIVAQIEQIRDRRERLARGEED